MVSQFVQYYFLVLTKVQAFTYRNTKCKSVRINNCIKFFKPKIRFWYNLVNPSGSCGLELEDDGWIYKGFHNQTEFATLVILTKKLFKIWLLQFEYFKTRKVARYQVLVGSQNCRRIPGFLIFSLFIYSQIWLNCFFANDLPAFFS
jgi:hypothetical protein